MIRSIDLSEVFDVISGHQVVEKTVKSLNESLNQYGLHVNSMAVENVSIPEEIAETLSKTTEWQILKKHTERMFEFDVLKINNQADQKILELKSANDL